MRAFSIFSMGLACALGLPACGLTLDYSPPDPERGDAAMDAMRTDAGPIQCDDDGVCDDGLRCTSDVCRGGICANDTLCPTGTDCVARGIGECRRPCGNDGDCEDGRTCTENTCNLADGHCALTSTCDAARPVCLANSSCAPETCATDDDCRDADACNGVESCVAGECVAGDPMVCPVSDPGSCVQNECDPVNGGCMQVPHTEHCDDGVECTVDECLVEATTRDHCVHRAVDSLCDDGSSCTTETCDVEAGCIPEPVECPFVAGGCIVGAACDPTTGSCAYERTPCAMGLVCTDSGCAPGTCESDAACLDLTDPSGCGFRCDLGEGLCVPRVRCPDSFGCAVPDLACVDDPSLCHYSADTTVSRTRCDDLDPATLDACVFDDGAGTFVCAHSCPPDPRACVTATFDPVTRICRRVPSDAICASLHGATVPPDCSGWLCTGTSGDGCERRALAARCDDGAACTNDRCMITASAGVCTHQAVDEDCADDAECTIDTCDPTSARDVSGCVHARDDGVCSSGGPLSYECAQVFCAGTSGVGATIDGVTYATGCAIRYSSCGTACADGACLDAGTAGRDGGVPTSSGLVCDPDTGSCGAGGGCRLASDCDDGNACTGVETCVGGFCQPGITILCAADPSGCESVCNPATGICERPPTPICD